MHIISGRLDCVKNKSCVEQVLKWVCTAHMRVFSQLTIQVQYLLSTGQYLQGTQRSVKAWAVHDLAVKGALQLGLHSATAANRFFSLD